MWGISLSNDPAGIFPSNEHRRVLGHLSHPDDNYGWTAEQLVARMGPDPDTDYTHANAIEQVLLELAEAGHAAQGDRGWQMTPDGFAKLTGPIADEPAPTPPTAKLFPTRSWHSRMLRPGR